MVNKSLFMNKTFIFQFLNINVLPNFNTNAELL